MGKTVSDPVCGNFHSSPLMKWMCAFCGNSKADHGLEICISCGQPGATLLLESHGNEYVHHGHSPASRSTNTSVADVTGAAWQASHDAAVEACAERVAQLLDEDASKMEILAAIRALVTK